MFQFDPKILQQLEEAGKRMMKEARYREMYNAPSSPFATGGYIYGDELLNVDEKEINQVPFYHECYNFKPNLTTSQKMRVFKFIIAIETAEEL